MEKIEEKHSLGKDAFRSKTLLVVCRMSTIVGHNKHWLQLRLKAYPVLNRNSSPFSPVRIPANSRLRVF
jgi:hypothetical protein